MAKYKNYILLFFVVAVGLFLRVYKIAEAPPGVYPDEAVNGLDALSALDGKWQWFYPANNGREGLFMNLIAICFKLFGVSVFTLKLPSIIFGTLTIIGVYFLAKELFRSERIGLLGAFLTATGFWAINFSRISFRANMLPAILVFSFFFLWKGLRTKKWTDFAIGGFIFGIGLHTYIAFRIAPFILATMLVVFLVNRRNFLKEFWRLIAVFALFAFLSTAPMFYTFLISHPEYLESRSASISILSPEVNQGHLAKTFLKSFSLSLLKYNFWGDQNWRHNFPPYPLLDPATGIAFASGFIYIFLKFCHLAILRFSKKIRNKKLEIYGFLLVSFFLMLVPEFMTAEGNPHALRAIGTLPFVFIFSAFTFDYFFKYIQKRWPDFKECLPLIFTFLLLVIGLFNSVKYVVWAKKSETAKSFEKTNMEIVNYIQKVPAGKEVFVVMDNMQRVPIRLFGHGNKNLYDLHPGEMEKIKPKKSGGFVVIFTNYQKDEIVKNIRSRFPKMRPGEIKNSLGMSFYIFQ